MNKESRFNYLLERVHMNTATPQECEELLLLIEDDGSGEWIGKANRFFAMQTEHVQFSTQPAWWDDALQRILQVDKEKEVIPVRGIKRMAWMYWAAASIVLFALTAILIFSQKKKRPASGQELIAAVSPAKEGALLTLANGTQVSLDTIRNGIVALQGGVQAKVVNGALVYEGKGNEVVYNTMSTPRGRIFRMTLPDGTGVWMNAASSIRFPTSFTGNERTVETSGEVYFEVAKFPGKPFKVKVDNRMEVEVLGTHFNVNAYSNEGTINTTLLEGAVKLWELNKKGDPVVLKPGQQAKVSNATSSEGIRVVDDIDADNVMAWKNGIFDFNKASLQEVMRQLERWYDIDVRFEGYSSAERFTGRMYRDLPLQEVLQQFGKTGAIFNIKGRTVIVSGQ